MAINGRINVDVLFHDTDGTTSLKVVSLEGSTEYTSGKVAIVSGTCGTANVTVATSPSTFRDASGAIVDFDTDEGIIRRFAFSATGSLASCQNQAGAQAFSSGGRVSVTDTGNMQAGEEFVIRTEVSGTAAWTLVIYGT
jgi:hypothetical protein